MRRSFVFQLGGVVSANTGPDGIAIVYPGHPRHLGGLCPAAAVKDLHFSRAVVYYKQFLYHTKNYYGCYDKVIGP